MHHRRIPLHFEPNRGQVAGGTEWIAKARGGTLYINVDQWGGCASRFSESGPNQPGWFQVVTAIPADAPTDAPVTVILSVGGQSSQTGVILALQGN